ncbi:MAG TPA: phospholipase D-like domain-containing protein [Gammaproteobacteria bacterium]|jgi:cardiolipin synthase|nr:phospholipase D-like domain-containing protein [Gammaproteobacteria bacterium]
MPTSQIVQTAVATVGFAAAAAAATHALLFKRRPQSAFGWIAVCFTLPFAGALLYYLFGINRVRMRARKLLQRLPEPLCPTEFIGTPPPALAPLERLGEAVTGWPLTAGNRVDVLYDAGETFNAMLAAIASAQRYVHLSTYIFDGGPVGRRFANALADAAARGVDVRVLLDGVGALYSRPPITRLLRGTGVRLVRFLPPRLLPPSVSVNLRSHRKSLVVDGVVAFAGGTNIRDRYVEGPAEQRIVDLHCRVAGPVVAQIETVFLRDWQFATGGPAEQPGPPSMPAGAALCRAVTDGPDAELDRLTALLIGAIGQARHRIAIMTPYFVPPRELITPLQAAALAGKDVAVILPALNNLPYIHAATRHMLWELLERGVHFYYQPPPFVHSKLLYVDDHYAQLGSANLDARSLRLNFEMNLEIYDRDVVTGLATHFEGVRARSRPVTLADVDRRSFGTKVLDGAAWLFSPYL